MSWASAEESTLYQDSKLHERCTKGLLACITPLSYSHNMYSAALSLITGSMYYCSVCQLRPQILLFVAYIIVRDFNYFLGAELRVFGLQVTQLNSTAELQIRTVKIWLANNHLSHPTSLHAQLELSFVKLGQCAFRCINRWYDMPCEA
jgi:hypothetical protein